LFTFDWVHFLIRVFYAGFEGEDGEERVDWFVLNGSACA
jgi:hypothetical protein